MPSIINSDDGVVSGTSGLKTTGGNDGLLNIQSNGSTVVAVTGSGISVTGTVSQTGVSTFAAGTVSAPSITFTGDTNTGIFSPAADTIAFSEGGVESMRIDASGNVGIGVTPSAWGTNKALQVERGGITSYISAQTDLFQNCYYDGSNWKYIATDEANKLTMLNGQFIMYSAPSGTAGNNITFTEVFQVNKDKTIALQGATQQTGTGITFPATQSASTDANTLDDYEEGTWTPTAAGGTGSLTAYTSTGRYIKIGKNVYCWGAINVSNIGTAGGSFVWGGAPFTSFDNGFTTDPRVSVFLVREDNSTGTAYQGFMSENSTSGAFLTLTNNPVTWANNTTWVFCFTYIAA